MVAKKLSDLVGRIPLSEIEEYFGPYFTKSLNRVQSGTESTGKEHFSYGRIGQNPSQPRLSVGTSEYAKVPTGPFSWFVSDRGSSIPPEFWSMHSHPLASLDRPSFVRPSSSGDPSLGSHDLNWLSGFFDIPNTALGARDHHMVIVGPNTASGLHTTTQFDSKVPKEEVMKRHMAAQKLLEENPELAKWIPESEGAFVARSVTEDPALGGKFSYDMGDSNDVFEDAYRFLRSHGKLSAPAGGLAAGAAAFAPDDAQAATPEDVARQQVSLLDLIKRDRGMQELGGHLSDAWEGAKEFGHEVYQDFKEHPITNLLSFSSRFGPNALAQFFRSEPAETGELFPHGYPAHYAPELPQYARGGLVQALDARADGGLIDSYPRSGV